MILVTGAAGFIGSNFVHSWLKECQEGVLSYDSLTYAGNLKNLSSLEYNKNHLFINGDISDAKKLSKVLLDYKPRAIINFAAETHVDRSIEDPRIFFETNVMGTYNLLQTSCFYWKNLDLDKRKNFRFLHISTDEVFGSLELGEDSFKETDQYRPNSPYSASKASSDHLVRSFFRTFNFPVITTNCSNNYGPYQFPEKLIPLAILNLIIGKKVPIYGDGKQIRDWLHVLDHCEALRIILENSKEGEVYNIGGNNEMKNIEVIELIGNILKSKKSINKELNNQDLISFVEDRPGHDLRYSVNSEKINNNFGWVPKRSFKKGIEETIDWYLNNPEWINSIAKKSK